MARIFDIFKRKPEVRSLQDVQITASTTDVDALGLIFGKNLCTTTGLELSAVYRAVDLISASIASLPLLTYKTKGDGSKVLWKKHAIYNLLLSKPNSFITAHDFWQKMMQDLLIHGNCYALIKRDQNFTITALEYINAKKVSLTKKYDVDGSLVRVLYNIEGRKRLFEDFELIHIKSNFLDDEALLGISILEYAKRAMKLSEYNEKAALNSYESGGRLSGIVSVNGPITQKQKDDMRQAWNQSLGSANSGSVAFLSGVQKYESVSQNNADLELLDSRQFNISEIARYFGLSPILLYDLSHQTYSSADAAHLALLTDCLSGYIYKIENELENKLFSNSEFDKGEIKFDTTEFLRADEKSRIENARSLFNLGVLSVNEIREMFDLESIEDGDEHYLQSQLVTLANSKHLAEAEPMMDNNSKPKTDENSENEEVAQEEVEATDDDPKNNDNTTDNE